MKNNNKKRNRKIITTAQTLIILLIIGVVGGFADKKRTEAESGPIFQKNELAISTYPENPPHHGFIIEYKETPELKNVTKSGLEILANKNEKRKIKQNLAQRLSIDEATLDEKTLSEYNNVFNGIALDITENEAEALLDLPDVAGVYPNRGTVRLWVGFLNNIFEIV